MATRRPGNRRDEPSLLGRKSEGKGGGMFMGVIIGMVIGLVVAAGLAWYFNFKTEQFKPVEQAPEVEAPAQPAAKEKPAEPARVSPPPKRPAYEEAPAEPTPAPTPAPTKPAAPTPAPAKPAGAPAAPIEERKAGSGQPPSRVPLTFYGILPGEKPVKPVEPPKPKEIWWLQIAALKNPADADKLKARLALLGLVVSTQKIEASGQPLYRVRVGPYKRDEDAFADLDTLSSNNYEPRLLKEPVP
jgi:cell division protein FtsN